VKLNPRSLWHRSIMYFWGYSRTKKQNAEFWFARVNRHEEVVVLHSNIYYVYSLHNHLLPAVTSC